jgi:antitoxin VapB
MVRMTRTRLFRSNRSQALRLAKDVAFPPGVSEVTVRKEGLRRVIQPADAAWDDFFAAPGIDLGARAQPEAQERETL